MADKRDSVYCNICEKVKYGDEVHPLQTRVCKSCNEDLKFRKDQMRFVQIKEWNDYHVIIKYVPTPETKED